MHFSRTANRREKILDKHVRHSFITPSYLQVAILIKIVFNRFSHSPERNENLNKIISREPQDVSSNLL